MTQGKLPTISTPPNIAKVAELTASGVPQSTIAKALGCSVRTVQRMLEDPLVKQAVADLRRAIRVKALEGVQVLTPAIYQRLAATVDHGAAKDIDALSRAALNLEKTAASASGENRPQAAQPPAVVQVAIAPGWGKPKPEMVALLASKGFQTVVDGEVLEPEPEPKP